ncbi:unnamed protein product [Camellia sinensis]
MMSRSCKTPCNNFSEKEHIFLLKRKLLSDFDNSDMRQPSIPFEGNWHEHLRQSAARPAGGVSVTSGNSGSAISSKTRIRWTQDLHDRFVECVNHLGGAERKYRIAKYMPDSAEEVLVMGLTWGMWDATIFSIHQKVILGADVLYDTSGSVFIATYHNKSGHHLIEFLMAKWGLKPLYKASGLAEIVLNSEEVR